MTIKSVKVTRTITYGPVDYIEWCEEEGIEPTQEGFLEFIEAWIYDDFSSTVELEYLDIETIGEEPKKKPTRMVIETNEKLGTSKVVTW